MTRKERLQNQLTELENRRALLIKQGKLLQAVGLDKAIAEKEEAIKDCEYHEYVPLHEVVSRDKLTEHKVYARLIEIALAADYLADAAIDCKETLQRLGVGHLKLMDDIEAIRRTATKLSGMPCDTKYDELYDLMMDNDELIDGLHILSRNYIRQKLDSKLYKV